MGNPKVSQWDRNAFIRARRRQYEAEVASYGENKPKNVYILEPPEEVICDDCNDEVPDDGQPVILVNYGRRAVCAACHQKNYGGEPGVRVGGPIIWEGSQPIVVGVADKDGRPVKTFTLTPGQPVPEEWLEHYRKSNGHIDLIGQDDPFDMSGVEKFYKNKKEQRSGKEN